jgi:hypothetical protein
MHVRGEPTHGYQRDQPSCLPGSGSSDRLDQGKQHAADVQKWLPTLDIESHINAKFQPRLEAGAQRTLYGVGCKLSLGAGLATCSLNLFFEPCIDEDFDRNLAGFGNFGKLPHQVFIDGN